MSFDLKTALAAIAERRTQGEIDEQDALNAVGRGKLDPDSPEARVERAKELEKTLHDEMAWLETQPDSELKTQRMHQYMDRLGELAAEQGDYVRAAAISSTPLRRSHYEGIVDAIAKDDAENCDCDDDLHVDRTTMTEFRSPAIFTVDRIVTSTGLKNLDKCRKCGFLNVR